MIQLGKFEGGELVADTNYLYPARWGWIKSFLYFLCFSSASVINAVVEYLTDLITLLFVRVPVQVSAELPTVGDGHTPGAPVPGLLLARRPEADRDDVMI